MSPIGTSRRAGYQERRAVRLPALASLVRAVLLLAVAFVAAAAGAGAWPIAVIGVLVVAGAGAAFVRARTVMRALNDSRRTHAEAERRYRRLYEGVAVGVLTADAAGQLTSANPALVRLLGYASAADLIAAGFGEHAYAGPGTFDAVLRRVKSTGELENLEVRLRRCDGLPVTALATLRGVWDDDGAVVAYEGTLLDITSLKLAESERRSMERRFRRLFDANAVGMLFGNLRRGTLDEANQRLLDLIGVRPSELPLALEALVPEDQRALNRELRAALETRGSTAPVAAEYLRPDGSRLPVLVGAALVAPEQGEFVCVVIDRSAEVAAAQRLADVRASYEQLLDAAPMPIASVDRERRYTYCNPQYREWLGGGAAPLGRRLDEMTGAARFHSMGDSIARALAGEPTRAAEDVLFVPQRSADGALAGLLIFVTERSASPAAWGVAGAEPEPAGSARPRADRPPGRRSA